MHSKSLCIWDSSNRRSLAHALAQKLERIEIDFKKKFSEYSTYSDKKGCKARLEK